MNQKAPYLVAITGILYIRWRCHLLLITDLILVLLCLVMIIAYFPSKPPHPPSKSQLLNDTPVTDYVQGVKSLLLWVFDVPYMSITSYAEFYFVAVTHCVPPRFRNKQFWIIMLITGLAVSTATSWLSLASANYRPLDIGQVCSSQADLWMCIYLVLTIW